MRVGWLADKAEYVGGAELTQAEFRAAAPPEVEIVDCPPGAVDPDCDAYAVHNCLQYSPHELRIAERQGAVHYWHDVGPWLTDPAREILSRMTAVCCSPAQAEAMRLPAARLIPPAIDLERFEAAGNGERQGVVSVGAWQNHGKAPHRAAEWAASQKVNIDFYGGGPLAPAGASEVSYADMPALLARYRTFVFLPSVLEPFGRTVVEAWASGLELVVNRLVGAAWWILERPEGLRTAAVDYWDVLLDR